VTATESPVTQRHDPLLPNLGIVATREYRERVRSRIFVVSTLLLAGLAIMTAMTPLLLKAVSRGSVTHLAVVSADAALATSVADQMEGILNAQDASSSAGSFVVDVRNDPGAAAGAVGSGALDGVLVVSRASTGQLEFHLFSGETIGADRVQLMQLGAIGVGVIDSARSSGATPLLPSFQSVAVGGPSAGGAPIAAAEYASRRIVGIVFVILIFITLVIYGMWVAAGVVAEKAGRVMELLISAASARQLVLGKIGGIGLAGLTQVAVVVGAALLALLLEERLATLLFGPDGSIAPSLVALSPALLAAFLVYFVLGFLLFAAIYAAAGSLVSRPDDLQVIALPLSLIAIVGYLQAVMALTGGTAGFIRLASYVPFWSPFVMLTRLSVGRVEPWELVVSIGLLVATIVVVMIVAVRIYAAGVLLYGQRPGVKEFVAAAFGR
jgi:ABC-2 type transport system permease protein